MQSEFLSNYAYKDPLLRAYTLSNGAIGVGPTGFFKLDLRKDNHI